LYFVGFQATTVPSSVWISGSSDGIGAEKMWAWCPHGEPVNSSLWYPNEPNNPGAACLIIVWNADATFADGFCFSQAPFLCEVVSIFV
jgi:hypothetical protein